MKRNYKTICIMFIIISLVVTGGLFLPDLFLKTLSESLSCQLNSVPAEYNISSGSATLQVASMQLSDYEKMRLISGAWDSKNSSVSTDQLETNAYDMVKKAKNCLVNLYMNDLYPISFSKIGSNWYSWEAKCYSSTDTTFHTYTAFYWLITLTKFDNTETHTILLTEDGTMLYAEANFPPNNKRIIDIAAGYEKVPYAAKKLCSFTLLDSNTVFPTYPNVEFLTTNTGTLIGVLTIGSSWITDKETLDKSFQMEPESLEFYYLFQRLETNDRVRHYAIGMIPYEGPLEANKSN